MSYNEERTLKHDRRTVVKYINSYPFLKTRVTVDDFLLGGNFFYKPFVKSQFKFVFVRLDFQIY